MSVSSTGRTGADDPVVPVTPWPFEAITSNRVSFLPLGTLDGGDRQIWEMGQVVQRGRFGHVWRKHGKHQGKAKGVLTKRKWRRKRLETRILPSLIVFKVFSIDDLGITVKIDLRDGHAVHAVHVAFGPVSYIKLSLQASWLLSYFKRQDHARHGKRHLQVVRKL